MSDRLHCPGCGIPTIECGLDTTEEELYCNRCVEELERNMNTNKPVGGAQFTPGPWVINANGDINSEQGAICWLPSGIHNKHNNATLIAAAPAMYEALQFVREFYQIHFDIMPVAFQTVDNICATALAQAEGRQG